MAVAAPASQQEKGGLVTVDLAYVPVFIGIFLVLALTLHGLERL